MFAGLVVVQKTNTSSLENFNILGFVMVGVMLWCLYLVHKVSMIVKSKRASSASEEILI